MFNTHFIIRTLNFKEALCSMFFVLIKKTCLKFNCPSGYNDDVAISLFNAICHALAQLDGDSCPFLIFRF